MSLEDSLYPLLSIYERMPHRLKWTAGFAYRMLPRSVRLGARFAEFEGLARGVENWSKDDIRSYQLKHLRSILIKAGNYSPFYQKHFTKAGFRPEELRSLDDMQRVPMLTRQDLLEHSHEMLSSEYNAKDCLYITTGGSTGVPVGFLLEKGVSRPKEQAFLEAQWRRAGYRPGNRVAVIRGHVTTSRASGRIHSYDATRNWLMLSSYHLTADRLSEYLDALERFRPEVLHAYPSAALQLAGHLEASGRPWRLPLHCLLCGSERLTIPQKRLLERVFQTRVYRWYGHSERVVLAGEGRSSELFYFWPTYGFVEFGPADEEGLREVIGTSFHNFAMPLIRYRTGDYVRVVGEVRNGQAVPDPSQEFPWPAVSEIAGREQEFLVSRTGRNISLTAFNMHDSIFNDLYAVQFFQVEAGRAELRYVPGPRFETARLAEIERGVRRKLGDDFELTLRQVHETEKTSRGKHRWLVTTLGKQ